jgi:hypothetical protein
MLRRCFAHGFSFGSGLLALKCLRSVGTSEKMTPIAPTAGWLILEVLLYHKPNQTQEASPFIIHNMQRWSNDIK